MPETTTTPTLQSKTFIALAVSAVAGLPALVQQINLLDLGMPTWLKNTLAVISVVALWLSPLLVRHSAAEAVRNVEAVAENATDVASKVNARVARVEKATGTGPGI